MKNYNKYIPMSLFAICVLGVGTLYYYHHALYIEYQKIVLNNEFVCPEKQTSDAYNSYLYRSIEFYKTNYPAIKLSNFLNNRYKQLVSHKCIKTLQNIATDNSANTNSTNLDNSTMGGM
jgi:hypothetical protein